MLRKILIVLGIFAMMALIGCQNESSKKNDPPPGGHPDELKDSTRLDPAPKQPESDSQGTK